MIRLAVDFYRSIAATVVSRALASTVFARAIVSVSYDRSVAAVVFARSVATIEIGNFIKIFRQFYSDSATLTDSGSGLKTDYLQTPFDYFEDDYIGDEFNF